MSSKKEQLNEAKEAIRQIFAKLEFEQVLEVKEWVNTYLEATPKEKITFELESEKKKKAWAPMVHKLDRIAMFLKKEGIDIPSKEPNKLKYPTEGFDSDCTELNTCEIDSFLYEDDDIDALVEHGMLSRTYCPTCSSRDTVPLNFISHSLSRLQVRFIFDKLMPSTVQHVLDIGSRLGAVIYGSSLFTKGSVSTVGVEMNKEYVEIAQKVIRQFALRNIEILTDDIRHLAHVFKDNQIIIMNNVFSFFLSKTEQEECWEFLHQNMRPGTILIHHPPIEKVVAHLNLSFDIDTWLEPVDTMAECEEYGGGCQETCEEMEGLVKYIVQETVAEQA